ncbi:MAG: TauD/TfdA family dioxygenase [Pseudomonadota bacterium]
MASKHVGHAEHHAFSRRFGPFAEDAYTDGMPGFREVQPIIKEADDASAHVFGSGWHTDSPFLDEPPAITILRAVETPPYGGDTIWANAALAWRMLGDTTRNTIAGLRVRFSMRDVIASAQVNAEVRDTPVGRIAATRSMAELPAGLQAKVRGNAHPLLRTHPRSGEQSLYIDPSYGIGIEGMNDAEGLPLLRMLCEHLTQPAFTCRLRWDPGTLALWTTAAACTRPSTITTVTVARCIAPPWRARSRSERRAAGCLSCLRWRQPLRDRAVGQCSRGVLVHVSEDACTHRRILTRTRHALPVPQNAPPQTQKPRPSAGASSSIES